MAKKDKKSTKKDFNKKIKPYKLRKYVIQEYIIGVPLFIHYFYSSLTNKIEIIGNKAGLSLLNQKHLLNIAKMKKK